MSLLEEFFYGNIQPSEKIFKKEGEYQKNTKEVFKKIENFSSHLNADDIKLSESIFDDIFSLNAICEKEYFIDGFCLGMKLMYEIINYKSEIFI